MKLILDWCRIANISQIPEKIKVARYYIGEVAVEFMESTSPDGEVAKFIEKEREGAFLISYKVDDLSKHWKN